VHGVSRFVIGEAERGVGPATVTSYVVGVRSLLRWAYATERIATPLAYATPWLSRARMASLPRTIGAGEGRRLLDSCDRSTVAGCRDYAALVLLCRLGLRVGEVVALEIGDIDWRKGELLVRSKGGWRDPLPIPVDVGEALAAYLRRRGPSPSRRVFLKVRAPLGPLNVQAVKAVVRHACIRVGVPVVSTHCLRHSVAADLLRHGSNLAEIGQVLRHREVATTAVYAKVDHDALVMVAQPWPVVS
jgi:integrase/recombinase XerD